MEIEKISHKDAKELFPYPLRPCHVFIRYYALLFSLRLATNPQIIRGRTTASM